MISRVHSKSCVTVFESGLVVGKTAQGKMAGVVACRDTPPATVIIWPLTVCSASGGSAKATRFSGWALVGAAGQGTRTSVSPLGPLAKASAPSTQAEPFQVHSEPSSGPRISTAWSA